MNSCFKEASAVQRPGNIDPDDLDSVLINTKLYKLATFECVCASVGALRYATIFSLFMCRLRIFWCVSSRLTHTHTHTYRTVAAI